jgi:hypothetical protein
MLKTKQFFIVLLLVLLFQNAHSQTSLTTNLLFYYPMNGNGLDYSGNGYDATVSAISTTDHNGVAGHAFEFNDSARVLALPNLPALHPPLPISLACWVKFDGGVAGAFSSDYTPYIYTGIWMSMISDNRVGINFGDGAGLTSTFRQSKVTSTQLDNNWHQMVFVIRGANDMDIYLDCVNDGGTYSGTGGAMFYSNNGGFIGKTASGTGPYMMTGKLDEFAMWDRALTFSDVEAICAGGLEALITTVEGPNSTPGLKVYPNPTMDVIQLEVSKPYAEGARATLMDLTGKCIGKVELEGTKTKIDVRHLAAGTYFVRVQGSSGQETLMKKFQKM